MNNLLGVPTLIKGLDQIKNGDASNGVYFNKNKVSKSDLMVAKEFKKLGFVILGQTNYPELGTRNITDSKLFGPAGNPWDSTRNAGGSSGGSASAVSSGMVAIASGSDAGGSIRISFLDRFNRLKTYRPCCKVSIGKRY